MCLCVCLCVKHISFLKIGQNKVKSALLAAHPQKVACILLLHIMIKSLPMCRRRQVTRIYILNTALNDLFTDITFTPQSSSILQPLVANFPVFGFGPRLCCDVFFISNPHQWPQAFSFNLLSFFCLITLSYYFTVVLENISLLENLVWSL